MDGSRESLFEYVLIVVKEDTSGFGLGRFGDGPNEGVDAAPFIAFQFPEDGNLPDALAGAIPLFCFPESAGTPLSVSESQETFSFILTGGDGTKQVGYCKRFLQDEVNGGSAPSLQCYCIISYL